MYIAHWSLSLLSLSPRHVSHYVRPRFLRRGIHRSVVPAPALPNPLTLTPYLLLGRTAILRLLQVSKLSPSPTTKRRALLRALTIIKSDTLDWELYNQVFSRLVEVTSRQEVDNELDPEDSTCECRGERDQAWLTTARDKAKREMEKLDAEMRNYSINMIKESARQTLLAQARHQRLCGDHPAAQRSFQKLRDFQSNAEHELETYLAAIEVALQDGQYNIVLPTVIKAQHALTRLASSVASTNTAGAGAGAGGGGAGVLTGDQVRERERRARQVGRVTRETNVKLACAKGVALVATGQWDAGVKELVGMQDRLGDWEGSVSRHTAITQSES